MAAQKSYKNPQKLSISVSFWPGETLAVEQSVSFWDKGNLAGSDSSRGELSVGYRETAVKLPVGRAVISVWNQLSVTRILFSIGQYGKVI